MVNTNNLYKPEIIVRENIEELRALLQGIPNRFNEIEAEASQAHSILMRCHHEKIHLQCMENFLALVIYQRECGSNPPSEQ